MAAMLESSASGTSGQTNAVTDASGNVITDGFGNPISSAGLNISLGLAPNTPVFDSLISPIAPANQMTIDAAAQALNMTPEDLAAVQAQTGFVAGMPSMTSTSGLDLTTLNQLSDLGLGNSPISNTQTVDQAIAAMQAHTFLNENINTIVGMMVPGGGAMLSGTQALGGLLSGVLTPGQALGHALGPIAGAVVPGLAGSIISSDAFGQATGLTPMTDAQLAAVIASSEGDTSGATTTDNTSGGSGNEVAAAPAPAPAPAPATAPSTSDNFGGLGALMALSGMAGANQPEEDRYQVAQIRTASPFGAGPYGLRNGMPYA